MPWRALLVRVNAAGADEHEADLELCRRHAGVVGVLLPKAESDIQVIHVAATGKPVWPIIESAPGVLSIASIAACDGVQRLTYGALDLALDLGLNAGTPAAETVFDHVPYHFALAHADQWSGTAIGQRLSGFRRRCRAGHRDAAQS